MDVFFTLDIKGDPTGAYDTRKEAEATGQTVLEHDPRYMDVNYEVMDPEPDVGIVGGVCVASVQDDNGIDYFDVMTMEQLERLEQWIDEDRQADDDERSGLH